MFPKLFFDRKMTKYPTILQILQVYAVQQSLQVKKNLILMKKKVSSTTVLMFYQGLRARIIISNI